MATLGIPGNAVAAMAAGAFLVWTGVTGQTTVEGARNLIRGRPASTLKRESAFPARAVGAAGAAVGTAGPGSASRAAAANAAREQIGKPYRWGAEGPDGFDCSGLMIYACDRAGVPRPPGRPRAITFLTWSGAQTIRRADCAAGDWVCYPGHIGMATGRDTMVDAPGAGRRVLERKFWAGAVIRRPR